VKVNCSGAIMRDFYVPGVIAGLLVSFAGFQPITVLAAIDCNMVAPVASVTTETDKSVHGAVETLLKVAKVEGNVESRMKQQIQNVQTTAPRDDPQNIKARTLYVFCGMVANATDISTERKVELWNQMLAVSHTELPPPARPETGTSHKPRPASSRTQNSSASRQTPTLGTAPATSQSAVSTEGNAINIQGSGNQVGTGKP
jgi:hypothetical protein